MFRSETTNAKRGQTTRRASVSLLIARERGGRSVGCSAGGARSLGWMLLLLAAYACLGGFLFGYDIGCINGALPILLNDTDLNLSHVEAEQVVAQCKVGAVIGALLGAWLMRTGHVCCFWSNSLCFLAGPVILAASRSWLMLACGRLITGIAVGLSAVASPTYLADIAPPRMRGCLVGAYDLALACGLLGSSAANAILQLSSVRATFAAWFPSLRLWQIMLGVPALPATLLLFGALFLPETPSRLIALDKLEAAHTLLLRLHGVHPVDTPPRGAARDLVRNVYSAAAALTIGCARRCCRLLRCCPCASTDPLTTGGDGRADASSHRPTDVTHTGAVTLGEEPTDVTHTRPSPLQSSVAERSYPMGSGAASVCSDGGRSAGGAGGGLSEVLTEQRETSGLVRFTAGEESRGSFNDLPLQTPSTRSSVIDEQSSSNGTRAADFGMCACLFFGRRPDNDRCLADARRAFASLVAQQRRDLDPNSPSASEPAYRILLGPERHAALIVLLLAVCNQANGSATILNCARSLPTFQTPAPPRHNMCSSYPFSLPLSSSLATAP